MTSIQFQPLVPWALWLVLATGGGMALMAYGARRPNVVSPRRWWTAIVLSGLAMSLVLGILLNPTMISPIPPPEGKPLLTILVDRSASMRVADQAGGTSRYQSAVRLAAQLERDLRHSFDVQTRSFADKTTTVSAAQLASSEPDGQRTDLATAIHESLDGSRVQGQSLVLLSDGIDNSGDVRRALEAAQNAYAMSAPVFSAVVGQATTVDDLDLSLTRPQELAFIGERTPVRAVLKQRGHLVGEAAVELVAEDGSVVDQQTVPLPPGNEATATFYVSQPKPGIYRYQVRTSPIPREATTNNNASTFVLRTVDRPIRVLFLEGKPYWDSKFLMRTLSQDGALELDAIVRVADGRFVSRSLRLKKTPTDSTDGANLPESHNKKQPLTERQEAVQVLHDQPAIMSNPRELAQYQILVLGRNAEAFLNEKVLEALRLWLSRDGGSLVCYRGQPMARLNQQLGRLMPVRWSSAPESRFRMQVTNRGQELSWIASPAGGADALATLPSLATAAKIERPTPLAVVVAQAPGGDEPVVSYQPYGCGRVVAIEGAGMWRWAFLSPEHQRPEPFYDALWQGLMRWLIAGGGLAPGQELALRTDKVSFFAEEPVLATLLVREEAKRGELPRVELKRDGRSVGSFAPAPVGDEAGVYRVLFGNLEPGTYRAAISHDVSATEAENEIESTVAFDVRPNFTEQLDTAARPDLLTQIAEKSGGALLPEVTAQEIERRFREHLAVHRPLQVRETTVWDRSWILLLVVGLWGSAWFVRRQRGLV